MGIPSTTTTKRDGPVLGRVVLVDGVRNFAEITEAGELKVISSGTSTTTSASEVSLKDFSSGSRATVSTTGALKAQPVTFNGDPVHPVTSTNAYTSSVSTTAGSIVLATTVASKFINIIGMKAQCSAACSFTLKSGSSTTISPTMTLAAAETQDWNLTNINGAPWFRSASAGDSIEVDIPSYAGNSDNALKILVVTTNTDV